MVDTAVRPKPTRKTTPAGWIWRTVTGIVTAAPLLTFLTVLLTNVNFGIWREPMLYLLVVGIITAVGGLYAAVLTAIAATVIVDYWFTYPLYALNPLAPDMLVFIGATLGVVALTTVVGTRKAIHPSRDVTTAVDTALKETAGVHQWAAVYITPDGDEYAIHPPSQDPLVAAQQLADGVHGLTCDGCQRCALEVA